MLTSTELEITGLEIEKICKQTLADKGDEQLLKNLQQAIPGQSIHLARTGVEWYRIGGVVDINGERIASDLIEWAERTYRECGKNLQTLIDHIVEQNLVATLHKGNTLYFVVQTGKQAQDFVQIEIDKSHEVSDRILVSEASPPEDLEDLIDPLEPAFIEPFGIGASHYSYRRKTNVAVFMEELNEHHPVEHPVQRFFDDWNRSSAGQQATMSDDWIIKTYQNTGRYGEQVINVEIVNTHQNNLPRLEDISGKKGKTLNNLLGRFDRKAGYPFAWYFYMVKGKLVSHHAGDSVFKDISGDFEYLPERDVAVLKDWVSSPYTV